MEDECLNPLLAKWLKERWEQARERNSKGALVYKKAYESMRKCGQILGHPSEAQKLQGIGPKLCDWLTEQMIAHCEQNGLPMPKKSRNGKRRSDPTELDQADTDQPVDQPAKKPRKLKPYVPALRSGAYAILFALSKPEVDTRRGLTKADLQREAQPYCDSSFTVPADPTKFYTAWKSIDTLLSKELVCVVGKPISRYILTDEGWEVANKIQAAKTGSVIAPRMFKINPLGRSGPDQLPTGTSTSFRAGDISKPQAAQRSTWDIADLTSSPEKPRHPGRRIADQNSVSSSVVEEQQRPSSAESLAEIEPIILPEGSFTVKLVLDTREVRTVSDRDYISAELQKHGVTPIIRPLELGDAIWVAQINPPYDQHFSLSNPGDEGEGNNEIVLDHVMERKRLDDLIASIKDGRFHEQKFRLRKSGVKNVTYLIEEYSISTERSDKYGEAVESAIASMQVVNGYFVKQTAKLDDTVRYLASMTKSLHNIYSKRELRVIPSDKLDIQTWPSMITRLREEKPDIDHYITFSAFSLMCTKSDSLTLRDVFLKMLMCTRGITGEKAMEIQKKWPTPRALVEAFESMTGEEAKKAMISDRLGGLIPRKKIAKGLSAKIAEIWG